ncbi:very long chain fatty acid elongase AAEL008004 [Hydra vulgaris]|uniref:very long chain fatty acid elongase AAEL008004 n=1 Tax=Hydra vulgaris TaxID=6087 RepID=UPI0032EA701F
MVLQGLVAYYNKVRSEGDPRTKDYLFVNDPKYVIMAALLYLVMVTVGPKFMESRKALQLRGLLIVYNFFSVLLSLWMMWEMFASTFLNPEFNLTCQSNIENDTSPDTIRLVDAHWWYFFSKLIEFSDTFFFVVRKKNNQISFLHTYHHVSMLLLQWLLVKYVPGGASYFGNFLNCFIHSIMYTYYMLAAVGPHMHKYLWWKKYLTKMQMSQFVLIFFYCSNAIHACKDDINNTFFWIHWFYMISLFWLFNHFYQTSYNTKTGDKEAISKQE